MLSARTKHQAKNLFAPLLFLRRSRCKRISIVSIQNPWNKVNSDARTIKVDTAWNNRDGFKSTKSGDDRIIEIAPSLLPMLKEIKLNPDGSGFVLPRLERWDLGQQAHDLRVFLAGMGLPRIRFHDLRATWATMLLSRGVEAIKVMKMADLRSQSGCRCERKH